MARMPSPPPAPMATGTQIDIALSGSLAVPESKKVTRVVKQVLSLWQRDKQVRKLDWLDLVNYLASVKKVYTFGQHIED